MKQICSCKGRIMAYAGTRLNNFNTYLYASFNHRRHISARGLLVTGFLPVAYFCFIAIAPAQSQDSLETAVGMKDDSKQRFNSPIFDYDLLKYPPSGRYEFDERQLVKLSIGDTIPDEILDLPLRVVDADGTDDTITLRSFYHKDLVVIDFWSVWCAPCIQSMQKWNDIIKVINDDRLAFIGALVFDQPYKAQPFISWKKWDTKTVIGENAHILNRAFFDRFVNSRIVWIKNNKVFGITGTAGYDIDVVRDAISSNKVSLPFEDEWTYKK